MQITLIGNDVEDDELTYLVVTSPLNGTLNIDTSSVVYTPGNNYNGADSFTYTVSDGELTSPEATVFITVNPVNDFPVLDAIDNQTTDEDTDLTIDLSASDVDIATDGQTLSFSATSSDENLVLVTTTSDDGTGIGTLTFYVQANQNSYCFRDVFYYGTGVTVIVTVATLESSVPSYA